MISRVIPTYSLTWFVNISKALAGEQYLPFSYYHIIAISGLRGAIAFSLALTLPNELHGHEIYTATLIAVIVSIVGTGTVMVPLLKFFNIPTNTRVYIYF